MSVRSLLLAVCVSFALAACSEPADRVMGSTSDGSYELTLSAEPNWVRPEASLLVRVTLLRRGRSQPIGFSDQIALSGNKGTVSPSSLSVSFTPVPADSSLARFSKIVTFRAGRATEEGQGEIVALFRDAQATLKVRIVPLVSD